MDETNTQDLLNAGRALGEVRELPAPGGNTPVIVMPEGYQAHVPDLEEIEKWQGQPARATGQYKFKDLDSFLRYFNEWKEPASRIFATITDLSLCYRGALNFHSPETPSFNDHNCILDLAQTKEWQTWLAGNKKAMSQCEFARFIEDNADLFVSPNGADLLELIQTLEGKADVAINQAVKLQTGAVKVSYSETVELRGNAVDKTGDMVIPTKLTVSIAPFEGTVPMQMEARLRYRIADRKISFWYESVKPHLVVRAVAQDQLAIIEKQTGLVPFKS